MVKKKKLPLIWLDELSFRRSTFPKRDYSGRNQYVLLDENYIPSITRVVIAAVSAKVGTVYIEILEKGNSIDHFLDFLKNLRKKMRYSPFALYMDNLRVHKARKVLDFFK